MKYIFILILLLLQFTKVSAQNPAFFKIGEKEFANNDIYSLLFDESKDVLYIGTDNGLFAYKQNKFVQINGPKEQIGNSIFSLKQDNKGQIYCNNLSGQVFKVVKDSLVIFFEIPINEKTNYLSTIFIQNEKIILTTRTKSREIDSTGSEVKIIFNPAELYKQDYTIKTSSQLIDGAIIFTCSSKKMAYIYKQNVLDSVHVDFLNANAFSSFFNLNDQLFSISNNGNISSNSRLHQNYIPHNKEQVFNFSNSELIGLNQKKGVHILKLKNDTLYESQHFFDKKFISSFCQKSNGMLFFGSFGNGIYVIPNRHVLVSEYDHLFLGMAIVNDQLFLSTRSGNVYKYSDTLQLIGKEDFNIDKIFSIYGNFQFKDIPQKGLMHGTKNDISYDIKDVVQIDHDFLLEATSNGVQIRSSKVDKIPTGLNYLNNNGLIYILQNKNRSKSVEWSKQDSIIYYSTSSGVFSKQWKSNKVQQLFFNKQSFSASDLEFKNDYLICGTGKKGVLFFKNNVFEYKLTIEDGLKSNAVKKIKMYDGRLFILTRLGLQIYNIKDKYFIEPNIKEGVLNSDITNFELNKNIIWLLEKNRFYSIELEKVYKNETIGKLYIDSVTVNKSFTDYHKNSDFKYDENEISFYFDYRNIETKNETKIYFILEGFNDEWKLLPTTENEIKYDYLPNGTYTFKIKAIYRNQSTKIFNYNFTINPPYWQTIWFYFIVLISFICLGILIFNFRIKSIKKRNQFILKQKVAEKNVIDAQLTAIRAQMNPHFIFNSINSIQDLILKKDTLQSYDYLVQFSQLVRNSLDYSEKEFIPLSNEIEFLNVYLNLEKLRFDDNFSYKITSDIHESIQIPTLITQPFVENAVKHGLLHKVGKKEISINFLIENNVLLCQIIDNGIGRKKAKEIKHRQKLSHKSFSTIAIKKRLAILEEKLKQKCYFTIVDLHDDDGNELGTEINIFLPKL